MIALEQLFALVMLVVVRFGIPLAVTGALGWWLYRMDNRWRTRNVHRLVPVHQLPTTPRTAADTPQSEVDSSVVTEACWVYRACPEERRNRCPAYLRQDLHCWLARYALNGRLPGGCCNCPIFAANSSTSTAAPEPA